MRIGARLSPGTIVPAHSTLSLMLSSFSYLPGEPAQKEVIELDETFKVPKTVNGYWYRLDALPTEAKSPRRPTRGAR